MENYQLIESKLKIDIKISKLKLELSDILIREKVNELRLKEKQTKKSLIEWVSDLFNV